VRAVANLHLRHTRRGPGRDNYDIGAGRANVIAGHYNAGIDIDPGTTGLVLQVRDDTAKFAAFRQQLRE